MAQRSTATQTHDLGNGEGGLRGLQEWTQGIASRLRTGRPRTAGTPPTGNMKDRLAVALPRLAVGLTALLLLAAVGLFAFRAAYHDRIYPAITVGDVNVGGLTLDQAQQKLQERATELDTQTVTFTYGGQTWTPTLSELGVSVQVDRALDQAMDLGRTGDVSDRLAFTGDLLRDDQTIPLRSSVDPAKLDAWFDQVDADINQRAVDASIVINGTTAEITQESTGVIVDRDAATDQILTALQQLTPISGDLPTAIEQPQIRAADLEPYYTELSASLQQPITAQFEGSETAIDPTTLTQYLTVTTSYVDGAPKVELSLDTDTLASDLNEQFAAQVNRDPVDATVAWGGDALYATSASVDGVTLKPEDFAAEVRDSFLGSNKRIDIPVIITKPDIDANNLGALGITSQLSTGDSDYANGTAERDTNIEVGISLLNGTLVRPGEDFSFNGAIGEITADKGYKEAGVIVEERIGRDIGGGICQVSTTTFRAALLAGFPMTEWWPHTYRLAGYEADGWGPGFDASILQEGSDPAYWGDFKFTNNTDGWLLVEAWTEYPKAYVRIYGTDDGRTVDISDTTIGDPIKVDEDIEVVDDTLDAGTIEQTEWPQDGVVVSFHRLVTAADGEVMSDRTFTSNYAGRGNVYKVSPDMQGQSPAAGNTGE